MTVESATAFDPATLRRCYAEWDVEGLLALYADDVEYTQLDRDHPPNAPMRRTGRQAIEGMARHCAAAGVKATVERAVADGDRAAATITCEFPGGRRVVANSLVELRDGRIAREFVVAIGGDAA